MTNYKLYYIIIIFFYYITNILIGRLMNNNTLDNEPKFPAITNLRVIRRSNLYPRAFETNRYFR